MHFSQVAHSELKLLWWFNRDLSWIFSFHFFIKDFDQRLRKLQITRLCVSWQLRCRLNFFVLQSAFLSKLPEVAWLILIFDHNRIRQASLVVIFICKLDPRDALEIVHPQRLTEINGVTLSLILEHLATDPYRNAAEANSQIVRIYPVRKKVHCLRSLFIFPC